MDPILRWLRPEMATFLVTLCLINLAAISVIYSNRVPNRLVGLAFTAALITALLRLGLRGSVWVLLGVVLAGGLALFFYWRGFLGAGDVKLLAATGALVGPVQIFYALFIAIAVLLLLDIISLKWQTGNLDRPAVAGLIGVGTASVRPPFLRIPCGVAIVLGANLSFSFQHWLR